MAEREIEWGDERIEYVDKRLQYEPRRDQYLTLGLSYLNQLVNTFSYEDRYRLLKPREKSPKFSFIHAFVFDSFSDVLAALQRYSEEEVSLFLVENSAYDDDEGPEEAWRWAFTDIDTIDIENLYEILVRKKTLRKRGYVMWDSARLAEWDLFDYDWRNLPYEKPIDDSE